MAGSVLAAMNDPCRGDPVAIRLGLLTTFPPTQCGIATFSHALATHLRGAGAEVSVVRVVDSPQLPVLMVSHQLVSGRPYAAQDAADALNACDVAILQHEYGIFGGPDGAEVLDVLDGVRVPLVAVLHTVLANPSRHQHTILARILDSAEIVVTMTHAGRDRLIAGWDVGPSAVRVIAHGAHDSRSAGVSAPRRSRPTVLTWGLLGEGKGIEWALEAVASVADLAPQPFYKVVGQTHPRVLERDGEAYRDRLTASVRRLGISSMVEFDARYLDTVSLQRIVGSVDVVLLPYDSLDQVTSGVLTEAVVAGRPVISTAFPHAVELLSSGAGLLVPRHDPAAIATALRRVLTEPGLAASMTATAERLAPALLWSAVAQKYVALAGTLVRARASSVA